MKEKELLVYPIPPTFKTSLKDYLATVPDKFLLKKNKTPPLS
jgi:hypothetical protein